jgi:hypothetical protein
LQSCACSGYCPTASPTPTCATTWHARSQRLPEQITSSQITYDLRRLRHHGLIERIPHTFRYRLTDTGTRSALFLTRVHHRVWTTGLAELRDPEPPIPFRPRTVDRDYQAAIDDLTRRARLPA